LKTPIYAPKIGVLGVFHPKMGSNINETPKGTSPGRSGSSGVLIMSVSSIVPEKSRGNKKCDQEEEEEEEKRHIFGLFGIAWLYATFLISICSLCRGQYADANI